MRPSAGLQAGLSLGAGKLFNATLQVQFGPKIEIPITREGANLEYSNEVSAELSVTVLGQGGGPKRTFWSSEGADDKREMTGKSSITDGGVKQEGKTVYKGGTTGANVGFGFSLDINWSAVGNILSQRPAQGPDLSQTCPSIACQK